MFVLQSCVCKCAHLHTQDCTHNILCDSAGVYRSSDFWLICAAMVRRGTSCTDVNIIYVR